jgi:hypothetical protein
MSFQNEKNEENYLLEERNAENGAILTSKVMHSSKEDKDHKNDSANDEQLFKKAIHCFPWRLLLAISLLLAGFCIGRFACRFSVGISILIAVVISILITCITMLFKKQQIYSDPTAEGESPNGSNKYDAIIVGSGLGGLATAACLSKKGNVSLDYFFLSQGSAFLFSSNIRDLVVVRQHFSAMGLHLMLVFTSLLDSENHLLII